MNRLFFTSLHLVLATLLTLGLCGSATAQVHFDVSGIATLVTSHGNRQEWSLDGTATPFGACTGTAAQKVLASGERVTGTATLAFAGGSLTLDYLLKFDANLGLYIGDATVVEGTGAFEGATGGAQMISERGAVVAFALAGLLFP
jgi:hypothetical protein